MKYLVCLLILLASFTTNFASNNPVYICTASDAHYYPCLLNLIGSLHKHNFNDVEEIAVFDLGLNSDQIAYLNTIEKVTIRNFEIAHPDLLKRFNTRTWGKPVPGWYAWKPVAIKQAFDSFGQEATLFWIDAGTTICKDLRSLFAYTQQEGYFFHNGSPWPLNKETTQFVKNAFNLESPERMWMLADTQQGLEAGLMGVTKRIYQTVVMPMYELTKDLRYFADDGSCPGGFGNSRHDISLYSILAFLHGYKIYQHWQQPKESFNLSIAGNQIPFHIACNPEDRTPDTHIYCARFDVNPSAYSSYIHFKKKKINEFVIVIPSYNNEQWCFQNLTSALLQKYPHYRIIYINDASTDKTLEIVKQFINEYDTTHKITLINNAERKGACANFYHAIHSCKPNEIIVVLDGDDWLAHENVLTILNKEYSNPEVWVTYGQYQQFPSEQVGGARQLPPEIIEQNAYREYDWVTTHLRTFYAFLFQKIKTEDLLYQGDFFPMACDLAIMFPILEMAGKHSRFISEVLYIYNRATPLNDNKINMDLQRHLDSYIHSMKKYQPI